MGVSLRLLLAISSGLLALTSSVALAFADDTPTFFVLETAGGLEPRPYSSGVGVAGSLDGGLTFHIPPVPLRFAVLLGAEARYARASGYVEGIAIDGSRRDLDLYLAGRVTLPIIHPLRVFGEVGFGRRFVGESVYRGALGDVSTSWSEPLLVVAGGAELRFSTLLSFGLRLEMTPLSQGPDPIAALARSDFISHTSIGVFAGLHF
jgi:hypothetical protein